DAWFVGYVPQLDTAVWMGYPGGEVPMQSVHGIAVTGGSFPAEIWRLFMERALGETPSPAFPQPSHCPPWKPFHRGRYDLSCVPYDATTTATTTTPPPTVSPSRPG